MFVHPSFEGYISVWKDRCRFEFLEVIDVLTNELIRHFFQFNCERVLRIGKSWATRKTGFGGIADFNSSKHML